MSDSKNSLVYVTLKVSGNEEHLARFLQLCKTLEYLGDVGATRTVKAWFDGDGAARLNFDSEDFDLGTVPPLPARDDGSDYSVDFE